jgi:NTE family protein
MMKKKSGNKNRRHFTNRVVLGISHFCLVGLMVLSAILSGGCSVKGKIANTPVVKLPETEMRYSFLNHIKKHDIGNIMFILAFSGGGTRAAALSYGVLEELKNTYYETGGKQHRLLDEVDRISSVSGGSFTAAYYGLFGDEIFNEFKDVFLYKDVEDELKSRVLGLFDTLGRSFSSKSRTEDAIEFYDRHIFKGKTFADLQRSSKPYILINASDLNSHSQFVFSQRQFDFLCSDLSQFKVARAVAASSAVPVLFHPILVKKHPHCNFVKPDWLVAAKQEASRTNNIRLEELVQSMEFYVDNSNPPYATLLDGGVTDNLGLRSIYRNLMLSGGAVNLYNSQENPAPIEHIVVLVVNASTTAVTDIGKSKLIPSAIDVITAVTDIQLHLFNSESNSLLKEELMELAKNLSRSDSLIQPYFIELSVDDVKDPDEELYLNKIPTNFYLEKEQADKLIDTAKSLLRQNEDYQKLLTNIGASVDAGNVQQ